MSVNKEHKEIHTLDMDAGWETPPGYAAGLAQKILSGALDEKENAARARGCCASRPARSPPSRSCTTTGKRCSRFRAT
jgi:hypothetical protein